MTNLLPYSLEINVESFGDEEVQDQTQAISGGSRSSSKRGRFLWKGEF